MSRWTDSVFRYTLTEFMFRRFLSDGYFHEIFNVRKLMANKLHIKHFNDYKSY